ncbi:unnamed protein product [Ambrosiozyma monospora]|uniref:Unnamed protein product n=1 Tax=Ambrosiozyma monospora TaxID=43982 RepID=A0ACB5SYJ5_AMBMO|nr:unnamed protein product [Ambrosiozyma monospora]
MSTTTESSPPVKLSKLDKTDVIWRRRIIFSIISIAVFIGIPLWIKTTTIHRAELPAFQINELSSSIYSLINYEIPVYLNVPKPLNGLIDETQVLIDSELEKEKLPVNFKIVLKNGDSKNNNSSSNDYNLELVMLEDDEADSIYVSPFEDRTTKLFLSPTVIVNGLVSDFIMRTLIHDIFRSEISMLKQIHEAESILKIPYSPNYHVTISLLQGGATPTGWDIEEASKLFVNYLNNLKSVAGFAFDSQVEHYERLSNNTDLVYDSEKGEFILKESDTSTFIDYSEWGLDQNTELVPSINFIVYVPDKKFTPIKIENSQSNSFIVPQWGGVFIPIVRCPFRT